MGAISDSRMKYVSLSMESKMMYQKLIVAIMLVGVLAISACSDDDPASSNDQATLNIQAEMTQSVVSRTMKKDGNVSTQHGGAVDSLSVSRVRILISELKLHQSDNSSGDKVVKSDPILLEIDSTGTTAVTTAEIPTGSYDKLKFEFHRFSSSEIAMYENDPLFSDFVTDGRYTFIIEGTLYEEGQAIPYTFNSDATANLSLQLYTEIGGFIDTAGVQPFVINTGSNNTVVIQIDPVSLFKDGGNVLDPRDSENAHDLDDAIEDVIKAVKKSL